MTRARSILLIGLLTLVARAEILDRIAVSVGNRVITERDVNLEIRITALLNGDKPDFSPTKKREAAGRMVDQALIRNELEASHYPLPSSTDVDAGFQEEKRSFPNDAAYHRALADDGVTEDDLRARLLWQLTLVRFIDARFRPGIQISDEDLRKYFDQHMRPAIEKAHPGQTPSFEDYRATVEQTMIQQSANDQVEQWLKEARRRTRIQYHDEVFE